MVAASSAVPNSASRWTESCFQDSKGLHFNWPRRILMSTEARSVGGAMKAKLQLYSRLPVLLLDSCSAACVDGALLPPPENCVSIVPGQGNFPVDREAECSRRVLSLDFSMMTGPTRFSCLE
jgi:hypothetical protein